MATIIILLLSLILLQFCLAYTQNPPSNLTRGSSLSPESISSWFSPSGLYAFGFYPQADGYRLGIYFAKFSEKIIVWTANRDNPPVIKNSILLLTTDGKLTVMPSHGTNTTIIGTPDHIYSASMLDSGNFVLYNSAHAMIWQSFDNPTDTILPGQSLKQEQKLISSRSESDSSSGPFCLRMQYDGNLVQYPIENPFGGDYSYWSSNTYENPGTGSNNSLNLDNNGKLYILRSSTSIKNLTQGVILMERLIFIMRVDVDGILRLYSRISDLNGNWSIKWESLRDKCAPKGLCGMNSYCILNDVNAECRCLNGFDFVDSSNLHLGCKRNFTLQFFIIEERAYPATSDNDYQTQRALLVEKIELGVRRSNEL